MVEKHRQHLWAHPLIGGTSDDRRLCQGYNTEPWMYAVYMPVNSIVQCSPFIAKTCYNTYELCHVISNNVVY